jgi:alcohol dehydrogenase class IV
MGVKDSDIELLSKNALKDPCLATNPNPAKIEDIARIFHDSL